MSRSVPLMRKGVGEGLEKKVCACLLKKKRDSKWVIYLKVEVEAQWVVNSNFTHQLCVNFCQNVGHFFI